MIEHDVPPRADRPPREPAEPDNAAGALSAAPLFAALTPLDRAKLAATLEDRWVPAGEVVFEAGGQGDALYILRSGTAERHVAGSAIETIVPPEVFGELALLTDEPRSASVVALTPLRLWVVPRARFHPLLRSEPELLLRLSAAVSRRLAQARTALGELQRELDAWVVERLADLSPPEQELVELGAILDPPDSRLLAAVVGADPAGIEAQLAQVAERSPLLVRDDGGHHPPVAIRGALLRHLEGPDGRRRRQAWRQRIGRVLEEGGDVAGALASYLDAGSADDAFRLYHADSDGARDALDRDPRLPPDWRVRLGIPDATSEPLERPPAPPIGSPSRTGLRDLPPIGRRAGASGGMVDATARATAIHAFSPRVAGGLVAALLGLLLWWTPPSGLAVEGWRALVVLVVGAVLLAFDVFPDAIVALLMMAGWVVPGLVQPSVALAGFASQSWLLVLCVLSVGVAVGNTGLLYRTALIVLGHVPAGFRWRAAALAVVGTLVTPTLPNATSRVALAAPLIRELAEALGYRPGTRAAAGLGLAGLVGFGQMSGLFLTGSSVGLLVHGLLPPQVRAELGFGAWFLISLPLHLALFGLSMAAIAVWYRPEAETPPRAERLALQRAMLGPPGPAEWTALAVLVGLVLGFLTEPFHGVNGAWLGVGALVILVAVGVLDATMLRTGVNWNFLIFFGVITSLGPVFSSLGIDRWLAETLAAPIGAVAEQPVLFCIGLALAGFMLSLVVRWQAAAPLLTLVATPAATAAGIHPFVIALIALVSTQVWFLPFQSTVYLALYHGSGELFSHTQARRLALVWGPLVLISLAVTVPVWQRMGLMR